MWTDSIVVLNPYEATKIKNITLSITKRVKARIVNFLYKYGYYRIKDLQAWGHCGLCGKPITNEVFSKDWAWGICSDCEKE